MAISTYMTFLMKKGTGDTWEKLVDIKSFPDLGGEPELLQTTHLGNKVHTYIQGIQDQEAMNFTANYEKEDFTALKALEGEQVEYAVWFGGTELDTEVTPTGSEGKFSFTGQLTVYKPGGGVNEVQDMNISIAPSTEMLFS